MTGPACSGCRSTHALTTSAPLHAPGAPPPAVKPATPVTACTPHGSSDTRSGTESAGKPIPAPLRCTVLSVDFITMKGVRSRITTMTRPAITRTVPPQVQPVIYREESSPAMANLTCPLERLAERLAARRRQFRMHALADNNFDPEERAFHDDLLGDEHYVIDLSAKRKLARHIEQMDVVTDYTNRLAKAIDLKVIDLHAERQIRPGANVVQFQTRKDFG